jgi:hypothetical protein
VIAERVCACGCGRSFWPHRIDQLYRSPWCRAAAWREKHPEATERRSERFAPPVGTDPVAATRETFTGLP